MITEIFRAYVKSYKDLPKNLYNIQWKFRDERRPRFGVMRGREFLMKDAYSLRHRRGGGAASPTTACSWPTCNIYARLGLKAIPVKADPGPIGGDLSHEFIILADTGESEVFAHRDLVEMGAPGPGHRLGRRPAADGRPAHRASTRPPTRCTTPARFEAEVPEDKRMTARGIEVGHIFYFGEKYSKPMKALVTGPDGKDAPDPGGSYGVGVSRLVAGDHRGQPRRGRHHLARRRGARSAWRSSTCGPATPAVDAVAEQAYEALTAAGKEPLLRRPRRPAGRQVRLPRPGRHPLAADRRPQGRRRGRGRAQAPRHRRAPDPAARRRPEGDRRVSEPGGVGDRAAPFGGWERMLAGRYLRAKRSQGGVALISIISFVGIMLAVAVLIIVMSVMNGFRAELLGKILGFNGHVFVDRRRARQRPTRDPAVAAHPRRCPASPRPRRSSRPRPSPWGRARSPAPSSAACRAAGPAGTTHRRRQHHQAAPCAASAQGEYGGDVVVVGDRLAEQLGVKAGDTITLISPSRRRHGLRRHAAAEDLHGRRHLHASA